MNLATLMADNQGMDSVLQVFDNVKDEGLMKEAEYDQLNGAKRALLIGPEYEVGKLAIMTLCPEEIMGDFIYNPTQFDEIFRL